MTEIAIQTKDSLIAGPQIEPLDLDEVKKELRFEATSEDTLLDAWIAAARQYFEEQTGRQLMTATWEYWLDAFPTMGIELPHPPLQAIVSIKYVDTAGVLQTLSSAAYHVQAPQGPQCERGWVEPVFGTCWPCAREEAGAVRVQFTAGYGDQPGAVPELIKSALYLLTGNLHQFRSEVDEPSRRGAFVQLPLGAANYIRSFVAPVVRPPMRRLGLYAHHRFHGVGL